MKYLVMLSLVGIVLCQQAIPQEKCGKSSPSCDPRGSLALNYLYSQFGDTDGALDVWLNRDYGPSGKTRLEQRQNRLEKLSVWAATLKAPDKGAYLGAIQYYEDGVKEAYSEWHTHKIEREQIAYDKHLKECAQAERESAAKVALPKPPKGIFGGSH